MSDILHTLPDNWETQRLNFRQASVQDAEKMFQILESCKYVLAYEGENIMIPVEDLRAEIEEGDIPPGGTRDRYTMGMIEEKSSGAIIGYLSFYHGYPQAETLYIPTLMIHKTYHQKGLGTELIRELCRLAGGLGYQSAKLLVWLKNWPALKFWIGLGFDQIIQYKGDSSFGESRYASLELEKRLTPVQDR